MLHARLLAPVLLLLLLAAPSSGAPHLQGRFVSYDLPGVIGRVAVGDFDADGFPDLAVGNYGYGSKVVLLRSLGDGTFVAMDTLASSAALDVAAADLDGDSHVDLVTSQQGTVLVHLGHGDFTFDPAVTYPGQGIEYAQGLAVADVSGDGILDVVAADSIWVRILPGTGGGALGTAIPLAMPGRVTSVSAADLDADLDLDIVAAAELTDGTYQIGVFVNAGAAVFGAPQTLDAGLGWRVAIGDLDGDTVPDVVAGARWWQGLGGGTLGTGGTFGDSLESTAVLADLDDDGVLDVLTVSEDAALPDKLILRLGHGDGTFGAATLVQTSHAPRVVTVADVDQDGRADLALPSASQNQVAVYRGHGDGTFGTARDVTTDALAEDLAVGDVTGDGRADVVETEGDLVRVRPGSGDGGLGAPIDLAGPPGARDVAIGDVDGDGLGDIVVGSSTGPTLSLFRSLGAEAFAPRSDHGLASKASDVQVADLDGDGRGDAVVADGANVSVLPGQAAGTLGARTSYPTTLTGFRLAVGFLDADAWLDVAVTGWPGNANVLLGSPGGALGTAAFHVISYYTPSGNHSLAIGDIDGDGAADLVTGGTDGVVRTLPGHGDGTFAAQRNFRGKPRAYELTLADVDGDARLDVVSANDWLSCAGVTRGLGGAIWAPPEGHGVAGWARRVAVGDLDGDGHPDLVTANRDRAGVATTLSVLMDRFEPVAATPRAGARLLAIARVWPNPARAALSVAFDTGAAGPVTLELLDLAGRRVASSSFGVVAAGSQVRSFAVPAGVPAGVYWVRVARGSQAALAKAVLLP